MKQFVAGVLTLGTALAGYSAYQSNGLAPLVSRIQTAFTSLSQPQPSSAPIQTLPESSFGQTQTTSDYGYSAILLPHLQSAFSPLVANQGTLSEEPLLRLREIIVQDHERAEAREALALLDQIRAVMRERESYRARFDADSYNGEFFRDRIAQDWLARARALAPPFQRAYGDLYAHEEKSHHGFAQFVHPGERFPEMARNDSSLRPRFDGHDSGAVVNGRNERYEQSRTPFEQSRNPLEQSRNPLEREQPRNSLDREQPRNSPEHYENPLEASSSGRGVGHGANGQPSTNTSPFEQHRTNNGTGSAGSTGATGTQSHPVSNNRPFVKPPPPPPPINPSAGGGA